MELTCLDEIIGLSQTTCECLEDGRPENYNVSKSGIFLDRLEGFNLNIVSGSDDCASGELWQRMAQAVEDAKTDYRSDLMGCVARTYKPKFNTFTGQIGQSTFKNTLTINKLYAGMKISPAYIRGGYFTINKIGVIINQTAPVTVSVYSNENGSTLLFTGTPINAIANTITWAVLANGLELPMFSQSGESLEYFILMELNGSFRPKDNKISCGCASSKPQGWEKWMSVYGVTGNDVLELDNFTTSSDLILNGIAVNVSLACKVSEIICSENYPLDFKEDGNAMNSAYAIRFRAGARLYEYLLSSDNINRFTIMNRERDAAKINEWNTIYMNYIADSCKNIDRLSDNDCLMCRDTQGTILKRSILV